MRSMALVLLLIMLVSSCSSNTSSTPYPTPTPYPTYTPVPSPTNTPNPEPTAKTISTPTVTVDIEIPEPAPTIDGRWRGIVVCDWDKEQWGGGEYKLGNGKLSGKIDFTVSKGTIKAGNYDYPGRGRFWMDRSGGGHKIQSFKVSKHKINIESKALENISNWEAH
jgi:hypothetical protein